MAAINNEEKNKNICIRMEHAVINVMDLFPIFLNSENPIENISPSQYANEMSISLEERFKRLSDRSRSQKRGKFGHIFTNPDVICFQNFLPHTKYHTTINIMHQKQHPTKIEIHPDLLPCFTLKDTSKTIYTKLAPGACHKLIIEFYADEVKDYLCHIKFQAEDNDTINVPVIALAPRPIFDIPDQIGMPETGVNILSRKFVYMRNIGKAASSFKISTKPPFSINPPYTTANPGDAVELELLYKNHKVETTYSELLISFQGVVLCVKLTCESKNCDVYVNKTVLLFNDTYQGLSSTLSFSLINNTKHHVKYQWKKYHSKLVDISKSEDYKDKLKDMTEYEMLRNIQNENPNVCDNELHEKFLQRIYEDEMNEFDATDQFLFVDENFQFFPGIDTIAPFSSITCEVMFQPTRAEEFESIAYFEVTGRETRQPLKLSGIGLGPSIILNYKLLDVGDIFLCAYHEYELVAKNESIIPATVEFKQKKLDFGGCVTCVPNNVVIFPGNIGKFGIRFSSTVQGQFIEYLQFVILESNHIVGFVLRGNVICPLIRYNLSEIDFGVVPFGFPIEKEFEIINDTKVPIEYQILIPNDGNIDAVTWVSYSRCQHSCHTPKNPKEFSIHPNQATIAGNTSVLIRVTLIANTIRSFHSTIVTYMWHSKKHFVELPIKYDCQAPEIEVTPSKLDIRYCFINSPYNRSIKLKNTSNIPGYIRYNGESHSTALECDLSLRESFIESNEEIVIHMDIIASALGLHSKYLSFTVFGRKPRDFCKLTCDVQGPVICHSPDEIKFGAVKLLNWHRRMLHLMNDSPVPAYVTISVMNKIFKIDPSEVKLEASASMEIEVSIYLTNVGKFSGMIILNVLCNVDPIRVPVSCTGIGSCILIEPILEPSLNLGNILTHEFFQTSFSLTNLGKGPQRLVFSKRGNLRSLKDFELTPEESTCFEIQPKIIDLAEKEDKTAKIHAFNASEEMVEEIYYCYTLDKSSKCVKMFETSLSATFLEPGVHISKSELIFRIDFDVEGATSFLRDQLIIANTTFLPLDIIISTHHPFHLINEYNSTAMSLKRSLLCQEEYGFDVGFTPPDTQRRCKTFSGHLKIAFANHPRNFNVRILGEVNYPTLFTFPDSIKNQYIPPMASLSKQLVIKSISPLPITFKYEWNAKSIVIERLHIPKKNLSSVQNSFAWDSSKNSSNQSERFLKKSDSSEALMESENCSFFELVLQMFSRHRRLPGSDKKLRSYFFDECQTLITNLVEKHNEPLVYERVFENMLDNEENPNDVMLNITPYQGLLQPYECSLVNFYLKPPPLTSIQATASCYISGGAEESIDISAACDDIAFDLSCTNIDLGKRVFCETMETTLTLFNTGNLPFEYVILEQQGSSEPILCRNGLLRVNPSMGMLQPDGKVDLIVKYDSEVPGEFNEQFSIEIGYLEPVKIKIYGVAIYSQVYLDLPRPKLEEQSDVYMSYSAISTLVSNLMVFDKYKPKNELKIIDGFTLLNLENNGWAIIGEEEEMPTRLDITLAIERIMGTDSLQSYQQLVNENKRSQTKNLSIPNFTVPAYELNFGNVILDGIYEYKTLIHNYGPLSPILKINLPDKHALTAMGINCCLSHNRLKVHDSVELKIEYKPVGKAFKKADPYIKEKIFIEVQNGPKIPIELKGYVGIPTMDVPKRHVDFGTILCGCCKKKTIIFQNNGALKTQWTCSFTSSEFFVTETEGYLEPNSQFELSIYFEPKEVGKTEAHLLIKLTLDPGDPISVLLTGAGVKHSLLIKESQIDFPPTVPYCPPLEKSFSIRNASVYPVEVFLPELDRSVDMLENMAKYFLSEKNVKKVYIPTTFIGPIPSNSYRYLYKDLVYSTFNVEENVDINTHVPLMEILASIESTEHVINFLPPNLDDTPPPKLNINERYFIEPEVKEVEIIEERKNKIFVFHGNKYTEFYKAANEVSKKIGIPKYSLDRIILQGLADNMSNEAHTINNILEEAYISRMNIEEDCMCPIFMGDKYDELLHKLEITLERTDIVQPVQVTKKSTKKRNDSSKSDTRSAKTKASTASKDKDKPKKDEEKIILGISESDLSCVISDVLDKIGDVIIESLTSTFFKTTLASLECLLKAARDVQHLYFVIFSCTYDDHCFYKMEEMGHQTSEMHQRMESIRRKVTDADNLYLLTRDERDIFEEVLADRRNYLLHRRMDLREHILNDLAEKKDQKKIAELKLLWSSTEPVVRPSSGNLKASKTIMHNLAQNSSNLKTTLTKMSYSNTKTRSKEEKLKSDDELYFEEFSIEMSEILFTLEYWDRLRCHTALSTPNFIQMMNNLRSKSEEKTSKKDKKNASQQVSSLALTSKKHKRKSAPGSSIFNDIQDTANAATISKVENSIGYPCWLIAQGHKNKQPSYIPMIIKFIKAFLETNCIKEIPRSTYTETNEEYVVVKRPQKRSILNKHEFFNIIRSDPEVVAEVFMSTSGSTIDTKSKRKKKKKKTISMSSLSQDEDVKDLNTRFILDPGQGQKLTCSFSPIKLGRYSCKYTVEVVGSLQKQSVKCHAICDIPRVDTSPARMFPSHVEELGTKPTFPVYITSENLLDFGTVLHIPENLIAKKTTLLLSNISAHICEIDVEFRSNSESFYCEEQSEPVTVEPNDAFNLNICAKPPSEGIFKDTLLISIEENPEIIPIKLQVNACALKFEVEPKTVNFFKIIRLRPDQETIYLKNNSAVQVYFELEYDSSEMPDYEISTLSGFIEPKSNVQISIRFTPKSIGNFRDAIHVNVYDRDKQVIRPVFTETVIITGEVTTFPLEYETKIDLGIIKGKTVHTFSYNIINLGKYDVKIVITPIPDPYEKRKLSDCFQFQSYTYVIRPGSQFDNAFSFNCNKEITFRDAPIAEIDILELNRGSQIENFVLRAAGKTVLSKFELCPSTQYFFGYQRINTKQSCVVTLKNVGHFEFDYRVTTPSLLAAEVERNLNREASKSFDKKSTPDAAGDGSKNLKQDKSSKISRSTDKKGKKNLQKESSLAMLTIDAQAFAFHGCAGNIQPGEIKHIVVTCQPTKPSNYNETMILFVSEPDALSKNGTNVTFFVEALEPSINFSDVRAMFPEQYVVEIFEDDFGDNVVYEKNKKTLHFGRIVINESKVTRIRVPNNGHVTASLQCEIKDDVDVFSVSPKKVDILPYTSKFFTVTFCPKTIGIWTSVLELKSLGHYLPPTVNNNVYLKGESCLPKIEIIDPKLSSKTSSVIKFDTILIGSESIRHVIVKNISCISCNVVFRLENDSQNFIYLEKTDKESNIDMKRKKNSPHICFLALSPNELGSIILTFKPDSEVEIDAKLSIYVMNNSFEIFSIAITGISFYRNVYLKNLPIQWNDSMSPKDPNKDKLVYKIDFQYIIRNYSKKIQFEIYNDSDAPFAFRFPTLEGLFFIPRRGHLLAKSEKRIIAVYNTKGKAHIKELLSLLVCEIKYDEGYISALSWDDRQAFKITKYEDQREELEFSEDNMSDSSSPESIGGEPPHELVGDFISINLLIIATCDYGKYYCSTKELELPSCHLYKSSCIEFKVENVGKMPLQINWTFKDICTTPNEVGRPTDSVLFLMISQDNKTQKAFAIEPKNCTIPVEKFQTFKVTFSPLEKHTFSATLKANLSNLDPELSDLEIAIKAKSLASYYQFEGEYLQQYLTSDSYEEIVCGLNPNENAYVLNFEVIGQGIECYRKFLIYNTFDKILQFVWKKNKPNQDKICYFFPEKSSDIIQPHKVSEVVFKFVAPNCGKYTDIIDFVPNNGPKSQVVLKGTCREPRFFFEKPCVIFPTTILNVPIHVTMLLKNEENERISFKFKKDSFVSDGLSLAVKPCSGLLQSKSSIEIRFINNSNGLGEKNFVLKCFVQYKSQPLLINAIASVVEIKANLLFYCKDLTNISVAPNSQMDLNIGILTPHRKEKLNFELNNTCPYAFYYTMRVKGEDSKTKINLSQNQGFLLVGEKVGLTANVTTLKEFKSKTLQFLIKIYYGPTFIMNVSFKSSKPRWTFSFSKYNFGKCLMQTKFSKKYKTILKFTNDYDGSVIIENISDQNLQPFFVDFKSEEVPPRKSLQIEIVFSPMELKVYNALLKFLINSIKTNVQLMGESVPLSLEVKNKLEQFLDLGNVRIGKKVVKSVKILNSGETAVDVAFNFFKNLPFHQRGNEPIDQEFVYMELKQDKSMMEIKKNKKSSSALLDKSITGYLSKENLKNKKKSQSKELLENAFDLKKSSKMSARPETIEKEVLESVEVIPNSFVKISPGKTIDLIFKFNPRQLINPFNHKIYFEAGDYIQPIIHISGSCIDANFKLNKQSIHFGSVVIGFSNEEKILLLNDGDTGARYQWFVEKNCTYIFFNKCEGYSPPGSEITTNIIFKPNHPQCSMKTKAWCQIENYEKKLEITIYGGSIPLPPPTETIHFECPVRTMQVKSIEIANDSLNKWEIIPKLTGRYFFGPSVLNVSPKSSAGYVIEYKPSKINAIGHQGSIFFPLPDGPGKMIRLSGMALPPEPIQTIKSEISCKTYHTEILPIKNWLGLRQQFTIITEIINGDTTQMIYKITSNNLLEVPPNAFREYKWTIYVVNEGKFNLKVTFMNEKSGEYIYFLIYLRVTNNMDNYETLKLVTCVRKPITKSIIVENPLDISLDYKVAVSNSFISVANLFTVPPLSKYELPITYLPLKSESVKSNLTIINRQIGHIYYVLNLQADAVQTGTTLNFICPLGQTSRQNFILPEKLSIENAQIEITNPVFTSEKMSTEKQEIMLIFEPNDLGIVKGSLNLISPMGEFTYSLIGKSTYPEAQGPFIVDSTGFQLTFKNPFDDQKQFNFNVDNNLFVLKPTSEILKAKKFTKIFISLYNSKKFGADGDNKEKLGFFTGTLSITCKHNEKNLSWVYYIRSGAK